MSCCPLLRELCKKPEHEVTLLGQRQQKICRRGRSYTGKMYGVRMAGYGTTR